MTMPYLIGRFKIIEYLKSKGGGVINEIDIYKTPYKNDMESLVRYKENLPFNNNVEDIAVFALFNR